MDAGQAPILDGWIIRGLFDSTDVAYIEKNDTTEVLTNYINDKVYNIYGDLWSSEESIDKPKFNTFKLLLSAFK